MMFRRNRPQQSSGSSRRYPFLYKTTAPTFEFEAVVVLGYIK